ncbi:hypothetical protein F1880_000195 [Penicillium rolfsii]|nr:hypothetical protein F1880_000195 [Penicillium rolfsii]
MSSDEIRPVSEGPASNEVQIPAPAPTSGPTAAPTPTTAPPASNARQPPIAGYRTPIHNPFPASLASECRKAGQIIDSFVNPKYAGLEGAIPARILAPAKGLVICSVFKAGFLGSVRFGSGLIVCRLPNGSWSAPSAVSLGGLGAGGQFGMEFTNFVFVLNTDAAVTTFINSGTLTLGGNISIAFGTGRSAETAAMIGTKGVAGIFAYSKTRGVYGGLTLEGGMIVERSSANKKLYDRKLKAKELLTGEVPPPPQAEPLMRILNSEAFRLPSRSQEAPAGDLPAPVPATGAQAAGTSTPGAPAAETQAPVTPAVDSPVVGIPAQASEAPVAEAASQQAPAVLEPETHSNREPFADNNARNVSQEAAGNPKEASITAENGVQPAAKEDALKDTQSSSQDVPGTTVEPQPSSAVDTRSPQPQV